MNQVKTTTLIGIVVVLAIIGGLVAALAANREQQRLLSITNFNECAAEGYPIMPARRSLGAGGESFPERCATPDGRTFVNDQQSLGTSTQESPIVFNGCAVAGCSGQLCVPESEAAETITTCEFRAEYACYKEASCEPQADGKCGWTETPELRRCLANPPSRDINATPVY